MHMLSAFMLIISVVLLANLGMGQECISLDKISQPVSGTIILCRGQYSLLEPIELTQGSSFDCQGSTINGTADTTAFYLTGTGITLKNCTIEGFKAAVTLIRADSSVITDSLFFNNEYALYLRSTKGATVNSSFFKDNAAAISFEDSAGNWIYGNTFHPTGLVDIYDDLNYYCWQRIGNEYIDELGPGCKNVGNESLAINISVQAYLNMTQVIKEEIPPVPDRVSALPVPEDDEVLSFMYEVLMIEGAAQKEIDSELQKTMDAIKKTAQIVDIYKEITVSQAKGTSKVTTRITVNRAIKNLYVYEYIPKCVAEHISDVYFSRHPDKVLQPDPIVVWHFPNANRGDDLELSYEVNREIFSSPKTIVVTEEINVSALGNCEKRPFSVPISKEINRDIRQYLPLIIIVFVILVYLYFHRFRKHFRQT